MRAFAPASDLAPKRPEGPYPGLRPFAKSLPETKPLI